jgi:hypothetical protein
MKTEDYTKNDGRPGVRYTLEKGDVIRAMASTPRETVLGKSKYPSYSIKAAWSGNEIYVSLTHGQYKRLIGLGDVKGKELTAVAYQGPSGKELVGLDVRNE